MKILSHDVFLPNETVSLSPFTAGFTEPGQGHNFAKSAARALDVLELFVQHDRPLRAIDVTKRLGISPSSVDQLLKTMVDCAYLIFEPTSKCYFPSPRLAAFGGWLSSNYFGGRAVERLMSSIQAATGEVVTLSACQGNFMQVVDVCQPERKRRRKLGSSREPRQIPKGLRSPLFGSASGIVWLASQPDDVALAAIARCRRELSTLADDPEMILGSIRRVREKGYVCGGSSNDDQVWTITLAMPPSSAGIVLIIGVAGPAEKMGPNREQIVETCREEISRQLYSGPPDTGPASA